MDDLELVRELSRRASIPEESAAAVLHAMHDLIEEGVVDRTILLGMPRPADVAPDEPGVVDQLIARAKKHPLGLEFLASGFLATVAITLGAHAFTVEAARRRLAAGEASPAEEPQSEEDQSKEDDPS
jgi:hypothetical protein